MERGAACGRYRIAPVPADAWREQAPLSHLRQADDLLSAYDAHARRGQGLRRHLLARRAQAVGKQPGRRAALGHFVRIHRPAKPARDCRRIPRRRAAADGMRRRARPGRQPPGSTAALRRACSMRASSSKFSRIELDRRLLVRKRLHSAWASLTSTN
jgi:hypothetical protein